MTPSFEPLVWPDDAEQAARFLASNPWPFHQRAHLAPDQAAQVTLADDETVAFWVRVGSERAGLIRVFDLGDLVDGSPLFDLRLAARYRGMGLGRAAVDWLTWHLFVTYPELRRIEATTRHDNVAMQRVFAHCGYRLEGRLVEAWANADGTRADTLIYAVLRREWEAGADSVGEHGSGGAPGGI